MQKTENTHNMEDWRLLLGVKLITYNRANKLQNTLEQLFKSPLVGCNLTIYDNHSTDDTCEVIAHYQHLWPNLGVVRRRLNSGIGPNYLLALEHSTHPYTWIICDDDDFDFLHMDEIGSALSIETADLIFTGGHSGAFKRWRGNIVTVQELMDNGVPYVMAASFIPGLIFRSALVDDACLFSGYRVDRVFYPHFPFIAKTVRDNCSIYVCRHDVVKIGYSYQAYADYLIHLIRLATIRQSGFGNYTSIVMRQFCHPLWLTYATLIYLLRAKVYSDKFSLRTVLIYLPQLPFRVALVIVAVLPLLVLPHSMLFPVRLVNALRKRGGFLNNLHSKLAQSKDLFRS